MDTQAIYEKLFKYLNIAEYQAPIFIEELLTYGLYKSIVISIMLTILIFFIIILFYAINKMDKFNAKSPIERIENEIAMEHSIPIITCLLIFLLSVFSYNINTIVKIKTAPKVYVLDYLKGIK